MHHIRTSRDAARIIHFYIAERLSWDACKVRSEKVQWRAEKDGWVSPRWVSVREYSKDVYRLHNRHPLPIMKSIWPFPKLPKAEQFKLCVHASEITEEFTLKLMDFVSASMEGTLANFEWDLFQPGNQAFPAYAWSDLAEKTYNDGKKKR